MTNTGRFAAWFVVSGDATADEICVVRSVLESIGSEGVNGSKGRPETQDQNLAKTALHVPCSLASGPRGHLAATVMASKFGTYTSEYGTYTSEYGTHTSEYGTYTSKYDTHTGEYGTCTNAAWAPGGNTFFA